MAARGRASLRGPVVVAPFTGASLDFGSTRPTPLSEAAGGEVNRAFSPSGELEKAGWSHGRPQFTRLAPETAPEARSPAVNYTVGRFLWVPEDFRRSHMLVNTAVDLLIMMLINDAGQDCKLRPGFGH